MPGLSEQKADLRKAVLARRNELAEIDRIEMSLKAADVGQNAAELSAENLAGRIVSGFLPIRSEIDARPLMFELGRRGARLCLPVVISRTEIEFREMVRGEALVESGFGTVGPDSSAAVLDPQTLLMPLSVFDAKGGRIGYGGGYYDRAIEGLQSKGIKPQLIGMAFSMQEVDTVPMEDHDRFLDGIITENGYRRF
ncbi:MAG: 5-formyltetrahydrofolate cyclo-ligase [Rhizobiaceae bacterium]